MIQRRLFNEVIKTFNNDRITLILGPRQAGKTTLLKALEDYRQADGEITYFFTLEDPDILTVLNQHPEHLFKLIPKQTKLSVFLDEIQYLDNPSRFLKYIVDQYKETIKLVVTGSSAFYIDRKFTDSLAGRKDIYRVYPFSFSEYLLANNEPKLARLFQPTLTPPFNKRAFLLPEKTQLNGYLSHYFRFGGYPDVVLASEEPTKKRYLAELRDSFLKKDFLDSKIRYEDKAIKLLTVLASQVGGLVNTKQLANQLDLSHDAVQNYLYIFQKSFIVSLVKPFYRNIKKELVKMPKVYFYDTGFMNSLLGTFDDIAIRQNTGGLFENMVFQSFLQSNIDEIRYWRTSSGNEVDFILNNTLAYECKINQKSFKQSKYKVFLEAYPEIPLVPIAYQSDEELDLLDLSG